MNIAPVGLKFLFSKTNFKGNFRNPDFKPNDAQNDNENNSLGVFVSPEVYLAMMKTNSDRRDEKLILNMAEASLNAVFPY